MPRAKMQTSGDRRLPAMNRSGVYQGGSGRSQHSGRICSPTTAWSPPRGPRTNRGRRSSPRAEKLVRVPWLSRARKLDTSDVVAAVVAGAKIV
jgi:hypothetical protein